MTNYEFAPLSAEVEGSKAFRAELAGTLDSHTVISFEKDIDLLLKQPIVIMILSIERLTYISSAGISALMQLTNSLRQRNGELILLKPTDKVLRVLKTLGFINIFRIVQDEEELDTINA